MPGSIQVTVLEAVDLPSETTDGEFVFVKVFVGKREFQTNPSQATGGVTTPWNSDFAFPVLNLRDNLEVILLATNGEQIGRNEIEIPSIVERGLRDEFFPLKGSGRIHLRLSFVLTDEERKRIEAMRASALKRKQQETSNNGEFQVLQPVVEKGKDSSVSTRNEVEKNDPILPTPSVNLPLDSSQGAIDKEDEGKISHSSPDQTDFTGSTLSQQKGAFEGASSTNLSPPGSISAHNSSTELLTESSLAQSTEVYSAAPAGGEASNEYSADEASLALQKQSVSSKGDPFIQSMLNTVNTFPEKEQSAYSTPLLPPSQVESNDTRLSERPLTDLSLPDQDATASGQPSISGPLVHPLAPNAANPIEVSNLERGAGEASIPISDHIPSHVAITPTSHLCTEGVSEGSPVTPNRAEASRQLEEEVVHNLNAEEKEMEEKKVNTEMDSVRGLVSEEALGELNSQITLQQIEQEASRSKLMEHKIMGDSENAELLSYTTDVMNEKQKQEEHKGQNSQNSFNVIKQLLGGAAVIVAGALFMWSRAGNDIKRSPSMTQSISNGEGRNARPIQSRST